MSDFYVDGKQTDWRELIQIADEEGCIWNDKNTKTASEAAKHLQKSGHEVFDKSPNEHCLLKLEIAFEALKEISEIRYKLSGIETEEAEVARKALANIESIK